MKALRAVAIVLGVAGVMLLVVAGPGTRFGLVNFRTGLGLLRYAAYVGIAGMVFVLLALLITRPRGAMIATLLVTFALAAVAFAVPWQFQRKAKAAPPIHDISTDTQDPPAFVAVLPLRTNALNPATYGGDSVAAQQHQAYPDIKPLELSVPPTAAFDRALAAAKGMGWSIVAADSTAGRIEATATTLWFGFKDDVVVRIQPAGSGSRLDVRSVSRVGKGDAGTNAARVRAYLARVSRA